MNRRTFIEEFSWSIAAIGLASRTALLPVPVPRVPDLLDVARRCKGRRTASSLMGDEVLFLAHVMTYGGAEELGCVERFYSKNSLRRVLQVAPSKVFDPMSWHFWHRQLLNAKAPDMPYEWFGFHRKSGKRLITAQQISQFRYGL